MMMRSSLSRGLCAAFVLWLLWSAAAAAASFQVSPARFEFSLTRRFTDFFNVTNNSPTSLRLRISTAFVDLDAAGKLVEHKKSPYDLSPWMVLNPRRVTLAAGEKRVVRFTVRPPGALKDGEYRTVVFFEELPPRPESGESDGTGFQVRLLTRLGITIYGRIGMPTPTLGLDAPSAKAGADGLLVSTAVRNSGMAHATVDVVATVLDAGGGEAGSARLRITVQREQTRPVQLMLPAPAPGRYRVRVRALVDDQTTAEAQSPFTAPSPVR